MGKPPIISDDPLIMRVRKVLKSVEPRPLPTETMVNEWGHTGWKCPLCGEFVYRRRDRQIWYGGYRNKTARTKVDYTSYNMHFAHSHATPFWLEKQIIALFNKG